MLQKISLLDDEPNPFENITFAQFMELFLHETDLPYGRYFDYIAHMWSLKDEPNILVVFYEDLKTVSNRKRQCRSIRFSLVVQYQVHRLLMSKDLLNVDLNVLQTVVKRSYQAP